MAEVAPEFKQGSFRFLGFDSQGGLQLIGGLVIGLIALYSSYDHVNFLSSTIHLNRNGAFGSSLPRWRLWLSMLNWRRDPGLEKKIEDAKRRSLEAEKRTMQLKLENARLSKLNARGRELLSSELGLIGSAGAGVMDLSAGAELPGPAAAEPRLDRRSPL